MEDQEVSLMDELASDYKDIDQIYREQQLLVQTNKMAIEDLALYHKALDNAIMKFHSLKMESINQKMKEMWEKTYQGNDIDTIEIRSDNEHLKGNRT